VQVDDRDAGKKKGFVDSLPPGKELQADRGKALNLETIHSDQDNIVTLGLPPGKELQPDREMTLNLETIHSDLTDIVSLGLPPGQELQADRGGALNSHTIHSDLDDIVNLGLPSGLELQADRGRTLNLEMIHSDLDDIVTRGLPPSLELNLGPGKSLPASWQAKVAPGMIVPDTDETLTTALPPRWELVDDRAKILPSTNPTLDDDDEGNLGWKLVPYFGVVLLCFSRIVQSGLGARKRKAALLEPNALWSIGSVNGARPLTLEKFAAACSTTGEPQQKTAEEKKGALLEHLSGDPDVEKARLEIEHAQEIEETFDKDFNGVGLS
jgi:hypothetical protein